MTEQCTVEASTRERQLTILDLPLDLLKRVLIAVDSIQHLHNLARVGLVSRSFAAVVKQQQHITVFGRDLRWLQFKAGLSTVEQFPMCLKFITYLELQKVEANQAKSMLQLANSFRRLTILDVCFKRMPVESLVDCMFECLGLVVYGAASLQEVHISHDSGIQLKVVSPGGPLRQHDRLACITAGSLGVLRGLVHCAAFGGRTDATPQTDQKTLSLLPALQWLEIDDEPLLTPFNGTVRGKLTSKTADTFLQAAVGHVTGIYEYSSLFGMDLTRPLNSITSWHSECLVPPEFIAQLAPNLTILNIKISRPLGVYVVLTPKLVSVDVSKSRHLGAMIVRGVPNTGLTHMCIQGYPLCLDRELYSWARARQPQPHSDLGVQVKSSKDQRHVAMKSAYCTNNLLSELRIDFSHGCVAVTTVDLSQM